MSANDVKIRWFNDACYELKLPSGRGILIDPYIDESPYKVLGSGDVEAADYVLISHTHFDHVLDLAKIADRFDAQIFAGQLSSVELARCYDIMGCRMNLCCPGDVFETEDFRLECFKGKHTKLGDFDRPSRWPENVAKDGLAPDTVQLNILGSYEYMIYLLTLLSSNQRILIWGGGATHEAIAQAARFQPNISIAQLPRESPDQIAALYAAIGGQVIFPHHHDSFMAKGEAGVQVIRDVVERTAALAPDLQVVCPEKGKWYTIHTSVTLD